MVSFITLARSKLTDLHCVKCLAALINVRYPCPSAVKCTDEFVYVHTSISALSIHISN
jgi:hypothetical protein